jgi:hypothetical protein
VEKTRPSNGATPAVWKNAGPTFAPLIVFSLPPSSTDKDVVAWLPGGGSEYFDEE